MASTVAPAIGLRGRAHPGDPPVMRHFWEEFRFCPRCGRQYEQIDVEGPTIMLPCRHCGYEFFQNSIPASTAVIPSKSRPAEIILLTRVTPPGEGLLALPGGFLQYGEPPVDGVRREVREEILIDIEPERIFDAYLVDYAYKGARVTVVELVFLAKPVEVDVRAITTGEASSVGYYDVSKLLQTMSRLAFPEHGRAVQRYREHLGAVGAVNGA